MDVYSCAYTSVSERKRARERVRDTDSTQERVGKRQKNKDEGSIVCTAKNYHSNTCATVITLTATHHSVRDRRKDKEGGSSVCVCAYVCVCNPEQGYTCLYAFVCV